MRESQARVRLADADESLHVVRASRGDEGDGQRGRPLPAASPGGLQRRDPDRGTLFLDELGEISAAAQAKLLRVLDTGEVQRVGSNRTLKVSVRIVSATNRDLEEMVEQGTFRRDLFERLDQMSITLPPLRARRGEILPLAQHFLRRAREAEGKPDGRFTEEAQEALLAHGWPGNVRELFNVVQRAAVMCNGAPIEVTHLKLKTKRPAAAVDPPAPAAPPVPEEEAAPLDPIDADERARVLAALERHAGNQKRAAADIRMPLRTLVRRLEQYGAPRPRKRRA